MEMEMEIDRYIVTTAWQNLASQSRGEVPGGQGQVRRRHEDLPGERWREESQKEPRGQGGNQRPQGPNGAAEV